MMTNAVVDSSSADSTTEDYPTYNMEEMNELSKENIQLKQEITNLRRQMEEIIGETSSGATATSPTGREGTATARTARGNDKDNNKEEENGDVGKEGAKEDDSSSSALIIEIANENETLKTLLNESKEDYEKLENEIRDLRYQFHQQAIAAAASSSSSSGTLNASNEISSALSDVTKTLARKVKSNLQTVMNESNSGSLNNEPSPASIMKNKAQEEAEMLKGIVVPLEEQIGALKNKLRETDALLIEREKRESTLLLSTEALASWLNGKTVDQVLNELKDKESEIKSTLPEDQDFQDIKRKDEIYISLLNVRFGLVSKELEELKDLFGKEKNLANKYRHELIIANNTYLSQERAKLTKDSSGKEDSIDDNNLTSDKNVKIIPISSVEWNKTLNAIDDIKNKLGIDGEDEINSLKYKELMKELEEAKKLASSAEKYREDLQNESVFRREVESKWNDRADQHKNETEALTLQVQELETLLEQLRLSYSTMYEASKKDLQSLTTDREKIVKELRRLQEENDNLVGKHKAKANEFQNEVINLPDKMEDIHLLLLSYREDLIAAKIAKEALEEKLKSEVSFMRAQISGEQVAKESLENSLTNEIQELREKNSYLESYKSEFEAEKKRRQEVEGKQENFDKLKRDNDKLNREKSECLNRITNLQQELDNSVAVQTDFVRLSQSLQMELEKIRQAEKEVRWQNEDDVDNCQNCKVSFTVTKRKHHCRHCGHIFCSDCVSKNVQSGPNGRPARVCDVCHSLLVSDSAPYFSTEAPTLN